MSRGLVDIVSNVLKSVKIKQDEDKYNYSTSRYEVVKRYSAANEYIEPTLLNSVTPLCIKPNSYTVGEDTYNGSYTHIKGNVNISLTVNGDITVGLPGEFGFTPNNKSKSYSDYISDKNDRRDEIYRDSLQRFYKYNMF